MDGATPLGTALIHSQGTQGTATFSTTKLTAGNNTMTAIYSGDGTSTNKASTSGPLEVQAYKTGPLLTVTSSADLVEQGATVTYTATVTNGSSTSGTVTFLDGGTSIGTGSISNGVATYTATGLSGGTHTITAVYTDGTNWVASVSKTFTERVQQAIPASVGSSDQTQFFVGTDSADDGESEGDGWTDAPWSAGRNSNSGSAPVFDDLMYRGQSVQWNDGVYRGEPVKMQLLGNQGGQATAAKGNTMPPGQESVPRTERPARDGIVVPNLSTQLQSLTNSAKNIVHNVGTTLRQVNDAVVADQVAALTHDTRPEFVKKIKAAVGQLGILEQQQLLRILRREHLTPSAGEALGRILSGSLHDNEAKPEQMAVEIRAALAKLARQRLPDTTPEDHVARRLADYTASVSDDNDIDVLEARYLQIVRELEEKEPKSWEKLAQLFKGDNPDGDTFLDDIHKKTGVTIFDVGTLKHYLATWEKGDKDSSKIANDTGGQTPEPEPPPDNDTGGQTPEQEPPPFPERYPTTNLDQPPPKPPETPPIHTTKTQTQEDRNYQDLIRNIPKWINEVKTEKAASDKAVAARRTNAEARMKEIEDAQKWATQYKGIWSGQLERLRPNRKVLGSEWLASSPEIDIGLDGKITFYNAYKKDQDWDENNPPEAPARELAQKIKRANQPDKWRILANGDHRELNDAAKAEDKRMKDELDELNRIQHMTLKEKLEHTFDLLKNDPKLIAQFGDTLAEVFSPANIAFMVGGSATIAAALASPLAPFAAPPIAGFGYYLLGDAVFTVGKDVVNLLVYTLDAKTPEHFAKAVEAGERLIQAVVQKGAQAAVGGIFVKLAKSGKGKSNKPAKASTNEPSKPPSGGDGGHGNGGGSSGSGGSGSSGSGASGHGRGSGSSGSGSGSSGSGSPPSRAGGSGAPKDESPHAGGGGQKGNGSRAGKLFGLREWEVAPGQQAKAAKTLQQLETEYIKAPGSGPSC